MKVDIVIVSYNTRDLLKRCLSALRRENDVQVWVVDNASQDGSADMVEKEFPWVHLVRNSWNMGFARANNKAADLGKSPYVLFLNPDTVVGADTVHRMVNFMEEHPRAGVVGCRLVNMDGTYQTSYQYFPTPFSVLFYRRSLFTTLFPNNPISRRYFMVDGKLREPKRVDWVRGAAMMIRRDLWDRLCGFDERFFLYLEDVDLCYRVWQLGWEVWYLPSAEVLHLLGGSTRKFYFRAETHHHFSMLKFFVKRYNLPFWVYIILFGGMGLHLWWVFFVGMLRNLISSSFKGWEEEAC